MECVVTALSCMYWYVGIKILSIFVRQSTQSDGHEFRSVVNVCLPTSDFDYPESTLFLTATSQLPNPGQPLPKMLY